MSWINEKGPISDVVLSSRVRLARNLADTPFPTVMDKVSRDSVVHRVRRSVLGQESPIQDYYQFLTIEDLSPDDRQILVEKHLASPDLMEHAEGAAILVNQQEICSIMVNEEDHVRLQCIFPGYQLNAALNYINRIDDAIEGNCLMLLMKIWDTYLLSYQYRYWYEGFSNDASTCFSSYSK